ncbi:MAG: CBS domain-containing protein, partial [Gammaproteobacteria bacterium]|nr:CBS domain-containing protein [Gammaproteobacteria bacterium]
MQVRDIMNTHVRTATPETSVRDVAIIICFNKISGVPVVDGRREIQGVISEKDILSAMYPGVDDYMQKEQAIRLE